VGLYFSNGQAGGKAFGGFLHQSGVGYMSEWGLAAHIADLEAVFSNIPGDHKKNLFLLGHSLGGSFVEAHGAWRFADGTRGAEHVAGLVLMDGALDVLERDRSFALGEAALHFAVRGLRLLAGRHRLHGSAQRSLELHLPSGIAALDLFADHRGRAGR
jgi:alpha-beta hydrolase superfamily lysophospholipase